MIKAREALLRRLLMLLDICVITMAFFMALKLRQDLHVFYSFDLFPTREVFGNLKETSRYPALLPLYLFVWWAALSSSGLYESFRIKRFFEVVWGIIRSSFFVLIVFATVAFVFKMHFLSRSLIVFSFATTVLMLSVERWAVVSAVRILRKRGYNQRNIIVVGTGRRAENFINMVHRHREWGMKIAGLLDPEKERMGMVFCCEKVIGTLDDLPRVITERVIDEVIFIIPRRWLSFVEKPLFECELRGIRAYIATDFFNMKIARPSSSDIEGLPLTMFSTTRAEEWQLLIKRLFDIIFSIAGIVVGLPLFATLFVVIKAITPGPAIFKQERCGLNGRRFIMYKFRTMVNGAEGKQEELRGHNEMGGPVFKMRNDPRLTHFGRFLRKTSLDELPQLFNILKGEMSFVGPRPPIPSEVEKYEIWQRRRLSMKPGLTCLWQANGRNNVDFEKWMKMDLEYIDNWSLSLDFKILLKTIPAVLFSVGAR